MCLQMVEKIATEGVANFSVNKNTLPFSERLGFHTCLCLWCARANGVSPLFIHKLMGISVSSPGIPTRTTCFRQVCRDWMPEACLGLLYQVQDLPFL